MAQNKSDIARRHRAVRLGPITRVPAPADRNPLIPKSDAVFLSVAVHDKK
jgi:hypothetical protein